MDRRQSPTPDNYPPQIEYHRYDLLSIPYSGPITRTKLSRLIKNNLDSVRVLMLAYLGKFLSKAISPK
jgi:hypothetical protein